MKTTEIKQTAMGFEIKTTEVRTTEVIEALSFKDIQSKLEGLRQRRAMDAQSFADSLAKTDQEITDLESLLSQADTMTKAGAIVAEK